MYGRMCCLVALTVFQLNADIPRREHRVDSILNQMSLNEKVDLIRNNGMWSTTGCSRLSIPGLKVADGPHGLRDTKTKATAWPVSTALAASWDRALNYEVALASSKEFRAKGMHVRLGNCLDLTRDPRYGRASESFGEDPYLVAQMGLEQVKGTQDAGLMACLKHFVLNSKEVDRFDNQAKADERTLVELWGYPFRTAIQQGNALSVMSAHSRVNGLHCVNNPYILNDILRGRWKYEYFTMNDWSAVARSVKWQKEATVEQIIEAGTDMEMYSSLFKDNLATLIDQGKLKQAVLDTAVVRVLRAYHEIGLLDDDYESKYPGELNTAAHRRLCRTAGARSMVLLKNAESILPLKKSGTIALVGPMADYQPTDARGSVHVDPYRTITLRDAIGEAAPSITIRYAKGCDINSSRTSGFSEAKNAARDADFVIYAGGIDSSQEGEKVDRVGGDFQLPGRQQELITELAKVNPNLVVVLMSGGICSVNECIGSVKSLVYAFYPGQEGGYSIADLLFGDVNPGGKLPVTMPATAGQLPPFDDDHREQVEKGIGYRWFDTQKKAPLFPFGYGLSYTTFEISNLVLSSPSIKGDQWVSVSVDVKNTGDRAGDEVVQLYVSDNEASVPMVPKQLKGFDRIALEPKETKTVTMRLGPDELCFYDVETRTNRVEAGDFTLRVGNSSASLPLHAVLTVTTNYTLPDEGVGDPGSPVRKSMPGKESPRRSFPRSGSRSQMRIHNLKGQLLGARNAFKDPGALLSELPAGMYIVQDGTGENSRLLGVHGRTQRGGRGD